MGLLKSLFTQSTNKTSAKAITQSPKATDKQFSNMVDNNLNGIELEKNGKVDEAVKLYEKNVSMGFEGNHPYDRLAIIYRKNKDYDNEIRVLEKAIAVFEKVNPSRPDRDPKLQRFKDRLEKAKALKNDEK